MELMCKYCNKKFVAYHKSDKYCSLECRKLARNVKCSITCIQCKKIFFTSNSRKHVAHFCSKQCWYKYRKENKLCHENNNPNWKGKIKKNCLICKKEYSVYPYRKDSLFCSKKCMYDSYSTRRVKEKAFHWKNKTEEISCSVCKKKFNRNIKYIDKSKVNYCSLKCYWNDISNRFFGENSSVWKGGISKEPYPFGFNNLLKETIRQRDDYICQICKVEENGIKHHIHHIDYNKNNIFLINLILLCKSCHGKTVSNRDIWESVLRDYQESRFKILGGENI